MRDLISDPDRNDAAVRSLQERLYRFYATTTSYQAFVDPPDQSRWYRLLDHIVEGLLKNRGKIRLLEAGAGRSRYGQYLGERRCLVEYHVQDVTCANRDYLERTADHVHVGDISLISGQYDFIFSTFVLEHVASPRAFLDNVRKLLRVGGVHVLICPRYDLPGYLCPSLRRLGFLRRQALRIFLVGCRLFARLVGRPGFWVNLDPAILREPWFRDADAVHVVSRFDVEHWHRTHGFTVERLHPQYQGLRSLVYGRFMLLSIACTKVKG